MLIVQLLVQCGVALCAGLNWAISMWILIFSVVAYTWGLLSTTEITTNTDLDASMAIIFIGIGKLALLSIY